MHLSEFQALMRATYGERDRARGLPSSIVWLVEEVGELAHAWRDGDLAGLEQEVGDVLAWLASVADQAGIDLEAAAARYAAGCPQCGQRPCAC
jgi:NTP pyrophosphatase (non-canonical NTP hydrolase)